MRTSNIAVSQQNFNTASKHSIKNSKKGSTYAADIDVIRHQKGFIYYGMVGELHLLG